MSIWMFLWLIIAIIVLGTTLWSTIILIQQKQAWKAYAAKNNLTFTPNKFFQSPTIEGILNGCNVSFFSGTQQKEDSRKNRQLTVVQVNINDGLVDSIGAGTKEMVPFLQALESLTPHDLKGQPWKKEHDLRSQNKKAVDAYLTPERLKVLSSILGMPKADVVILLDAKEGVVRFETANPLHDEKVLQSIMSKLMTRIQKLMPSEEEKAKFKTLYDIQPTYVDLDADETKKS